MDNFNEMAVDGDTEPVQRPLPGTIARLFLIICLGQLAGAFLGAHLPPGDGRLLLVASGIVAGAATGLIGKPPVPMIRDLIIAAVIGVLVSGTLSTVSRIRLASVYLEPVDPLLIIREILWTVVPQLIATVNIWLFRRRHG